MPTGDALEAVGGAELRTEAIEKKHDSIAIAETAQRAAFNAAFNAHEDGSIADGESVPTAEDLVTLRRVPTKIPPKLLTIAFVELCERFSYYGTTVVCMPSTSSFLFLISSADLPKSPTSSSMSSPKARPPAPMRPSPVSWAWASAPRLG